MFSTSTNDNHDSKEGGGDGDGDRISAKNMDITTTKTIFVTVGTTRFQKLIDAVTSKVSLEWMISNGYTNLILQYGTGYVPSIIRHKITTTSNNTNASSWNEITATTTEQGKMMQQQEDRNEEEIYFESSQSSSLSSATSSSMKKKKGGIYITCYNFKSTLEYDMKRSDLIISHAGAGTVMEGIKVHKKKLCVVINNDLMDNHQLELATAMSQRGHLFVVYEPSQFNTTTTDTDTTTNSPNNATNEKTDKTQTIWDQIEQFTPIPYNTQDCDEYDFPRLLDTFLGFSSQQ